MLCPRCNSPAADTATICPQCGSALTPTSMTSFSYLPAGTPPWHAARSMPPGATIGGASSSAAPQVGSMPSALETSGAKKARMGIPSLLLLFLVTILVGGGATFGVLASQGYSPFSRPAPQKSIRLTLTTPTVAGSPTTTGTSPTPSGTGQTNQLPPVLVYQKLNNADTGISLEYPSTWVVGSPQKDTNSTFFTIQPSQRLGLFIAFTRYTSSASSQLTSTSDVNQGNLTGFQSAQGVTNFKLGQGTTQDSIGGISWDQQDASFGTTSGLLFHATSIAVQYKQLYYEILFYAPDQVYQEAMTKYYTPMLQSFKFLT